LSLTTSANRCGSEKCHEVVDIGTREVRLSRHPSFAACKDCADGGSVKTRSTIRDQCRTAAFDAQSICAMAHLAILLIGNLSSRWRRRVTATSAAGILVWTLQMENPWVVVGDNVDRAIGLACRSPE
jgi:hypothetical protein